MSSLPKYLKHLHEHTRGFNSGRKYSIPGTHHTRNRSRSPIKEEKHINAMTVKEIKMELGKAGVDYSNAVEKYDLVERLKKYRKGKKGGSRRRTRSGRRTRRCY
jgi:hypothetical protein